jgi:hypothetical protein
MEGCYNRPFLKRLRIVVGTPYRPEPPADGVFSHEYQKQQCAILYQKTKDLQALLHQKKRKNRPEKENV